VPRPTPMSRKTGETWGTPHPGKIGETCGHPGTLHHQWKSLSPVRGMYFRELTLVLLTAYVEPYLSLHVFLCRFRDSTKSFRIASTEFGA